ncbi:MAG: sialate O-acetylesterase, partial [Bacteroidota bacterium]
MPRQLLTILFSFAFGAVAQAQELSLFESFTDHSVLQRDMPHPLWGWTKHRRKVTVNFMGKDYKTKADNQGRWEVTLPATPVGGPFTITVSSGRERRTLRDVYFGDVYLLSGQSNMEWRVSQSDPDGSQAAKIADPMIRELKVKKTFAATPQQHLTIDGDFSQSWMRGDEAIANFSAVGSYFARDVRAEIDVPIGLLHASWGGSRIEPWMSPEALGKEATEALKEREDA